ncbi:MAG TPA: metallophosphoesterase [Rectinemataceae bacterium]|nr:metallophosphoesterase [Rectinemataceae bacterium]
MDNIVLVHLSDIHFTRSSGVSIHDLDTNVRNELRIDAVNVAKDIGTVTGLLVTGDIAFSGSKAEYDHATEWLSDFCRAIGCPEENVWVVPGNHDVDRKLATRKVTRTLHQSIREEDSDIDKELQEIFSDSQSAAALLEPLTEYNTFVGRFGCSISAEKYYWERDLNLACGTVIRLRGLTSTLVSNADDKRGGIVLGTAQASVARASDVFHVTLCHHPPDWFRDQDAVEDHLKSKVHIQLFGHKHSQRLDVINGNVRLVAGAMHPERGKREWNPTYNFLELSRRNNDQIGLRVYQRNWSQQDTKFVAYRDPTNGMDHREFFWSGYPVAVQPEKQSGGAHDPRCAKIAESAVSPVQTIEKDHDTMPPPNHKRRLTYRFLTLPFRHQIAVAQSLNVLTDEDRALSDEALFRELFKRAAESELLAKLWEETEIRHADPAAFNPFES